jgi:hypothetical protein
MLSARITTICIVTFAVASAHAQTYERYVQGSQPQFATSIAATSDGGYIMAGWTQAYGVANGYDDVYLVRTDGDGDVLWTRTYGGNATDDGLAVAQTSDDGFLIAGGSNSFGSNGSEVYLIRTDANGDTLWTRTYGGPGEEYAHGMALTADGGAIIVGQSGVVGGPNGGLNAYVIRIDATGDTLWTRTYDGGTDNFANSVSEVVGGDHILAGTGYFGASSMELIRIHDNGDVVWNKEFSNGNMEGRSAIPTADLGFIACGQNAYDACLVKVDGSGAVQWAKTYGGPNIDYGYCVREIPGGGYVFSGEQFSHTWLVRTDVQGDTLWHHTYATGNATTNQVVLNADGGFTIGANRTGFGGYEVQIVRTDATGNIPCDQSHPSSSVGTISPVEAVPTLVLATLGEIHSSATVVGSGGAAYTSCTTVDVAEQAPLSTIRIGPDPATTEATLIIMLPGAGVLDVLDAQGRSVLHRDLGEVPAGVRMEKIDVRAFASGVYTVVIANTRGERASQRLVVGH